MALTDAELRRQLKAYGVNPGPITDTTRDIYLRRLDKLKEEKKVKPSRLAKDVRSSSTPTQSKTRERSKSPILRSTRYGRKNQKLYGYSTDEDDAKDASKKPDFMSTMTRTALSTKEARKNVTLSKNLPSTETPLVHQRVAAIAKSQPSSSRSPKRRSSSLQPAEKYSDDSDDDSERSSVDSWVEMESTETNTTPGLQRNGEADQSRLRKFREEIEEWKREEEKNYSKNSTRRTSDSKINRNGRATSSVVTQKSQNVDINTEPQTSHWTLSFSSFLPIGTCIFFIVLGLLYATMKYDPSMNTKPTLGPSHDEVRNEQLYSVMNEIFRIVATDAGNRECGYIPNKSMEVSSLKKSVKSSMIGEDQFQNACQKFVKNTDCGLNFYDKSHDRIETADRCDEAHFVDSEKMILNGWCRFIRAVQKVLLKIVLTTIVGVAIWLGLVYRRRLSERRREEREQMFILVQKILDVLRRQYDMSENDEGTQPYLPILHVRDMILQPKNRKKMARIWERAKQFLSASETRIRVENQTVQGEDYLVWRWIQASSPAKRHTPTSRVWQGEAFDVTRGPMICPTPCLKIRNVFNPNMEVDKNWIEQIQDSILEKCQGNNEILRICVEKDSKEGLVYMLCASNQAAGRAFQTLHGAWFDGRLVTVKFIRLHRFHQRFPESVHQSKIPMQPTSEVPVSTILATPSPLEAKQSGRLYPVLPDD